MPAIKKISREAIIDAAVDTLRESGAIAINARNIAKKPANKSQVLLSRFLKLFL